MMRRPPRSTPFPSTTLFRSRANKSAAQANVRPVLPDAESYNADNVAGAPAASDPDQSKWNTPEVHSPKSSTHLTPPYQHSSPSPVSISPSSLAHSLGDPTAP